MPVPGHVHARSPPTARSSRLSPRWFEREGDNHNKHGCRAQVPPENPDERESGMKPWFPILRPELTENSTQHVCPSDQDFTGTPGSSRFTQVPLTATQTNRLPHPETRDSGRARSRHHMAFHIKRFSLRIPRTGSGQTENRVSGRLRNPPSKFESSGIRPDRSLRAVISDPGTYRPETKLHRYRDSTGPFPAHRNCPWAS